MQAIQTMAQGLGAASPDPCLMVIFGASGDLAARSLVPSLYELAFKGLLPEPFAVLGFSASDWIDQAWRIVDPLIAWLGRHPPDDLPNYPAGSWGPAAATRLIERDCRVWHAPLQEG